MRNRSSQIKKCILPTLAVLVWVAIPNQSWAQKKRLDLEDIAIKGELYGDDRLNMLSRQENELKNYVKFRTNYRLEIVEALPEPRPGVSNKLK